MSEIIRPMRCAVYTRKSTSEGLEQNFNSLDAQREACMAYITSQRGEGWTALDTHYDDETMHKIYANSKSVEKNN